MRGLIVFEDSHTLEVASAAEALSVMFRRMDVDCTVTWYFDDDNIDRGTEYGVRMEFRGVSPDQEIAYMRYAWQLCVGEFPAQEIRLEVYPR